MRPVTARANFYKIHIVENEFQPDIRQIRFPLHCGTPVLDIMQERDEEEIVVNVEMFSINDKMDDAFDLKIPFHSKVHALQMLA
jgi:hypothetical protein